MYEMIMFCNIYSRLACRWVRQPSIAIWLSLIFLYDMRVNIQRHVIALVYRYELAIVVVAMTWWWQPCGAPWRRRHAGGRWRSCQRVWWWRSRHKKGYTISHIMNCMWCLSFMHLILLRRDSSIIRWSLTLNTKNNVFSLSVHRRESSSFWSVTWWSGIVNSTFAYDGCKPDLHMQKY